MTFAGVLLIDDAYTGLADDFRLDTVSVVTGDPRLHRQTLSQPINLTIPAAGQ